MSIVTTITDHWTDGKRIHVIGTLVLSGNYVVNGDLCPLNYSQIKSQSPPTFMEINGKNGYNYEFVPGTNMANGRLKAYSAYATEFTATAYPAGITGDTITFYAIFPKFI